MGVFGWWDLWTDSWALGDHPASDAPGNIDRSEFPRELRASCKLEIEEEVDLESLFNYAGVGIDRRQDILREYLRTRQRAGILEEDISVIYRQYSPKSTIWQNMGRWHSMGAVNERRDARGKGGGVWAFVPSTRCIRLLPELYYSSLPRNDLPCVGAVYGSR